MTSLADYMHMWEELCSIEDSVGTDDPVIAELEKMKTDIGSEIEIKVDNWIGLLDASEARLEHYKKRRDEINKEIIVSQRKRERLLKYLAELMQQYPTMQFKGKTGTMRLQKNPPSLETSFERRTVSVSNVFDPNTVNLLESPELAKFMEKKEYWVLSSTDLLNDVKANGEKTWAHLKQGFHIRIKP